MSFAWRADRPTGARTRLCLFLLWLALAVAGAPSCTKQEKNGEAARNSGDEVLDERLAPLFAAARERDVEALDRLLADETLAQLASLQERVGHGTDVRLTLLDTLARLPLPRCTAVGNELLECRNIGGTFTLHLVSDERGWRIALPTLAPLMVE